MPALKDEPNWQTSIYKKGRDTVSELAVEKYNPAKKPRVGLYELWNSCKNMPQQCNTDPMVLCETFHILRLPLILQFTMFTLLMVHILFTVKY